MLGINPNNPMQARVFYDFYTAYDVKEDRHPELVMKELSKKHNFTILFSVPQTIADGWDFWIEFKQKPNLPTLFRDGITWKRIGQV